MNKLVKCDYCKEETETRMFHGVGPMSSNVAQPQRERLHPLMSNICKDCACGVNSLEAASKQIKEEKNKKRGL